MKICVSRRQTPDAKPKICVSPDAKPRRQSVEYSWRWVPTQMLVLAMYISCFLCRFHLRLYPTRTQFPVEYGFYVFYLWNSTLFYHDYNFHSHHMYAQPCAKCVKICTRPMQTFLRLQYTEDAGLPYFDRASFTANGYW